MRNIFKKKEIKQIEVKELQLSDISLFDFKTCYAGDLSCFNNDADKWQQLQEKYEDKVKAKGTNVVLELQKQIAMKENTIQIMFHYLKCIEQNFKAYMNTQDLFWIDEIIDAGDSLGKYGIKFNKDNDLSKEHNRCVKLINNKANDIQQDLAQLKEATKGGITFDKLIAIVGKWSGTGIINQKGTTTEEFCEFYNLMIENGN